MMRTWEKWNGSGKIDVPDYQAAGTLTSALSVDAENALTGLDVNLTRKIFQALTDTDVNNRRVSRPTALSRLSSITGANPEEISKVIERFIEDRRAFLLRTDDELSGDALIRISHEALIRQWPRLRDWVDEEARDRDRYIRLAGDAENHEVLWQNPRLQTALQWRQAEHPSEAWAERYHAGFRASMRFLDESAAQVARLERIDRTLYAGAVGWIDGNGDGEWAVGLRCAEVQGRMALLFAGAGIVADSEPDQELAETDAKFRSMLDALGYA